MSYAISGSPNEIIRLEIAWSLVCAISGSPNDVIWLEIALSGLHNLQRAAVQSGPQGFRPHCRPEPYPNRWDQTGGSRSYTQKRALGRRPGVDAGFRANTDRTSVRRRTSASCQRATSNYGVFGLANRDGVRPARPVDRMSRPGRRPRLSAPAMKMTRALAVDCVQPA